MADMLELQFGITSQDVDDARAEAERSRRAAVIAQSIASGSQLFLENRPPARIIRPGHCYPHNKRLSRCKVGAPPAAAPAVAGTFVVARALKLARQQDCGGGSVCPHNRQRSQCTVGAPPAAAPMFVGARALKLARQQDCGGGHICPHKRRRSQCKVGAPPAAAPADAVVFACV